MMICEEIEWFFVFFSLRLPLFPVKDPIRDRTQNPPKPKGVFSFDLGRSSNFVCLFVTNANRTIVRLSVCLRLRLLCVQECKYPYHSSFKKSGES